MNFLHAFGIENYVDSRIDQGQSDNSHHAETNDLYDYKDTITQDGMVNPVNGDVMTYGNPDFVTDTLEYHHQPMNGFCVPYSLNGIIEEFQGHEVPETDVIGRAAAAGLIEPVDGINWSGMDMNGAVELLQLYGIDSHVEAGNIDMLRENLAEGHKIMLAVNSSEIWGTGETGNSVADHAVWLIGFNDSDPAHPTAIVNDPGYPDGMGREIPIDIMEDAWSDSGHMMVVTEHAPDGSNFEVLPLNSMKFEVENGISHSVAAQSHHEDFGSGISDGKEEAAGVMLKGYWFSGPDGNQYYKDGQGFVYDVYNNRVD